LYRAPPPPSIERRHPGGNEVWCGRPLASMSARRRHRRCPDV
jgi:hypothetical protein